MTVTSAITPMNLPRRAALLSVGLATAFAGLFPLAAAAQEWPTKAVRLISPYPVGGGPDAIARVMAEKLSRKWGKPVVVENKPGGNGFIAIDAFKRGATDGHDLLQLDSVHLAAYPYMFKKLPYDVNKDFEPIAPMFQSFLFYTVPTASKYKKVSDIIADAKANPGKINYGLLVHRQPGAFGCRRTGGTDGHQVRACAVQGNHPALHLGRHRVNWASP